MIFLGHDDLQSPPPAEHPDRPRRGRVRSVTRRLSIAVTPIVAAAAAFGAGVLPTAGSAPAKTVIDARQTSASSTFYASPSGSDTNPGTPSAPWKSMFHAAKTAQRGDTIVFGDGTYVETQTARFTNGGTASLPITFKAANKQKAKLVYPRPATTNTARIRVAKPYINFDGLDVSSDAWDGTARSTDIIMMFEQGADHGKVTNSRLHGAFEEGLKASQVTGLTVTNNSVYDTGREGIDLVNVSNTVIRGNYVAKVGRTGIMAKGGSRNVRILANTITDPRPESNGAVVAITLGGNTIATSAYDTSGYEGYRLAVVNNAIHSTSTGGFATGVAYRGCADCASYNNVFVGTKYPVYLGDGGDVTGSGGIAWTARTTNPTFVNNISTECQGGPLVTGGPIAGTTKHDYNLYYNCPISVKQAHGVGDPHFVNPYGDWHLRPSSPAIDAGLPLTTFPSYTDANTPAFPALDLRQDRAGSTRVGAWDLGLYDAP